jgi:hypothetical protein
MTSSNSQTIIFATRRRYWTPNSTRAPTIFAGYAVECALKACICSRTNQFDFYAHPEIARRAWSHKFANLIDVSGLKEEFEAARLNDSVLEVHSNNVEDWSEDTRYKRSLQEDAQDLYSAVSDPVHGVLACIKRFW